MKPLAPKTLRKTFLSLTIVSSFSMMTAGHAGATIYNDAYTLRSTGQNAMPTGAWNLNTGFQGAQWGSYNGNGPVSFGVNAISGSAHAVIIPAVPGTPGFHVPGTGICLPFVGCDNGYDVPGIPGTPAVYGDTRTGTSADVNSSGRVGFDVNAGGRSSNVSVTLPFTTQMNISNSTPDGRYFHVSTSSSLGNGAAITATGATFSGGVAGVINLDNHISAANCFFGAGCNTSSSDANLNLGKFDIVGIDTANSHPFSAFGQNLPVGSYDTDINLRAGSSIRGEQGPIVGTLNVSQLSDLSGGTVNRGVLSLSGGQRFASIQADLTGIAQKVLGAPADLLNVHRDLLGLVNVDGTLLDARLGVNIGLSQSYAIDPHQQVTLQFDRLVTMTKLIDRRICSGFICFSLPEIVQETGTSITLDVGENADFNFNDGIGNLLSRSYSVASNAFTTNESVTLDPMSTIEAGCFDVEITRVGGTGRQCAYHDSFGFANQAFGVASAHFSLAGFNTYAFDFAPPGDVPEPATILLSSIGLASLAFARRRTNRSAKTSTSSFLA